MFEGGKQTPDGLSVLKKMEQLRMSMIRSSIYREVCLCVAFHSKNIQLVLKAVPRL